MPAKRKKVKRVHASQLSNLKMVAGNEKKYSKVIHQGMLKEWVAIGWVDLREPTKEDRRKYPQVVG